MNAPPGEGGARLVAVAAGEAGLRLDRWLRRRFPGLTQGRIEKLLRTGQIRLEGGRARAGARLEAGQSVRLPPRLPEEEGARPPPAPAAKPASRAEAEALRRLVLYRDDDLIAIDKPAGLAVQGGPRTGRHLDAMLDALRFGSAERPRLVHRLDRDTSGVLVLARSGAAAARLAALFRRRETVKTYLAVVVGVPRPRQGRIEIPLAKAAAPGGTRETVRAADGEEGEEGRRAVTLYRVLDAAGRRAALVELKPLTGRTHQLRAHMAAIGTPILGDGKYGGRGAFLPGLAGRLHLHALAIELPRQGGRPLRLEAPVPRHLRESRRFLGLAGPPI
ncbi:MAG: RluA family pseudouridine synthase [Proteobacteria bacterium]|nr:RluA family pseudouridine synthase [Pseudomonadota bacterium]